MIHVLQPNGEEETIEDSDLLWALGGGMGGTFGIVTELRYKLYPNPESMVFARFAYFLPDVTGRRIAEEIVTHYTQWMVQHGDDNHLGGHMLFSNVPLNVRGMHSPCRIVQQLS